MILARRYDPLACGERVYHEDRTMVLVDHDDGDCDKPMRRECFYWQWEEIIDDRIKYL